MQVSDVDRGLYHLFGAADSPCPPSHGGLSRTLRAPPRRHPPPRSRSPPPPPLAAVPSAARRPDPRRLSKHCHEHPSSPTSGPFDRPMTHLPPLLLPCPACLVLLLRAHPPPPSPVLCILAVAPDPAWPPAPNGQPTNPTDCDQPPSLVGFSIRRRRRWRRWGLRGKDVHI